MQKDNCYSFLRNRQPCDSLIGHATNMESSCQVFLPSDMSLLLSNESKKLLQLEMERGCAAEELL